MPGKSEIGRMIVEHEQQGKERAEYGKHVLKDLSKQLTADFGKGFSVQNLENMRKFYLLYGIDGKSQSMIRISEKPNAVLSWTDPIYRNLPEWHRAKMGRPSQAIGTFDFQLKKRRRV